MTPRDGQGLISRAMTPFSPERLCGGRGELWAFSSQHSAAGTWGHWPVEDSCGRGAYNISRMAHNYAKYYDEQSCTSIFRCISDYLLEQIPGSSLNKEY